MRRTRPGRKSQVLLVARQVSGVWEFQVESSGGHVHVCGSNAQEETQRVFAKPGVRIAVKCRLSCGESGLFQSLGSWPELGRLSPKPRVPDFSFTECPRPTTHAVGNI